MKETELEKAAEKILLKHYGRPNQPFTDIQKKANKSILNALVEALEWQQSQQVSDDRYSHLEKQIIQLFELTKCYNVLDVIDYVKHLQGQRERIKITEDYLLENGYTIFGFDHYVNDEIGISIKRSTTHTGKFLFRNLNTDSIVRFIDELPKTIKTLNP